MIYRPLIIALEAILLGGADNLHIVLFVFHHCLAVYRNAL